MGESIRKTDHALEPWEKRVDVLRNLLGDKERQVLTLDGSYNENS